MPASFKSHSTTAKPSCFLKHLLRAPVSHLFSQCSLITDLILCSPFCLSPPFENFIQVLVSVIFPCSFCFCLYFLQHASSRCKSGKTALERCGQLEKETSHRNLAQNFAQLHIYLGFLVVLNLLLIPSRC